MKTIDNIMTKGKTGLVLLTSLFILGGCTEMIKDSPIGWYHRAKEEIKAEVRNENQREERDSWKGTAIVKRDIYPDGTVIFVVDANRVGHPLSWDYTDAFIGNINKYDKEIKLLSTNIGLIKYIPKE